ncbi:MAG: D-alanine--D-alanine ligase [Bacteroidales bacterium]|nr:D-alanine--D-alanine ligase [Bacteroidales bacterium]
MKKNIAIIAGGDSGEYPISIKSATMVAAKIDPSKYSVFIIEIKGFNWVYKHPEFGNIQIDKNDFSLSFDQNKIVFDLVFNLIHGSPGENGKLQGYFDLLGLPYTSSNVITSAITFNKAYCNQIVRGYGVAVSKNRHVFKSHPIEPVEILKTMSLPVFVKPNQGGSSVGMSKVNHESDLSVALDKAFAEDDEILIEEYIKGRELTCGIFKYKGEILRLPVTEILSKKEFFDYEAKYNKAYADEITPAAISAELTQEIQETSARLYQALNCKGIVRFDFISSTEKLWFLEVNTVPGMSNESIVPQQIEAAGYNLSDFYGMMIEEALNKG